MPKDIDEDLIEATIRRVQAQASSEPAAEDDDVASDSEEDAIAATIKRVQEQAARAQVSDDAADEDVSTVSPAASLSQSDDEEDAIAATIRRVQEQAARAQASNEDDVAAIEDAQEPAGTGPALDEVVSDDDPISETIRRVQAQAAARNHDESSDFAPAPLPQLDDDEDDSPALAVEEDVAPAARSVTVEPRHEIEVTSWPGRDERLLGEPATWEIAAQRLEQGLQDNSRQVQELAARLEALLPALEQLVNGAGHSPALKVVASPTANQDEDWDDTPVAPAMQFGAPPRPAVLRDPAPHSAAARELEEVPQPAAAHLRPVEASSLDDRLPRQYRITVEDKRRGVDLVPLHRAMQSLQNVRDMSLLSYNNGVAIVLVETVGALDPESLREAVGRAMARETKIEVHNESTMVVKVQED